MTIAIRHALGWLVFGNAVGLYLSLLLCFPSLQAGPITYGRLIPVHLNVQLYGWTAMPLLGWLLSIYEVDFSQSRNSSQAAVWSWSAALAIGVMHWLAGSTSGKIFLDWQNGSLWAFVAAQLVIWWILAAAWRERSSMWSQFKRYGSMIGLAALAMVPVSMVFAASPEVYPPVDKATGGPTGSSLLGSTLFVIGLMLLLPRATLQRKQAATESWAMWGFFILSWIVFAVGEAIGGSHYDTIQIVSLCFLLPWVSLIPRDWRKFRWGNGSEAWRMAMILWWAILVVSGCLMYFPGILDRLKFTQGLVAHSHLAMAGFTTSFCALLAHTLSGNAIGGRISVGMWQAASLVMVFSLAVMGWLEGESPAWMQHQPLWRSIGLHIRTVSGLVMLLVSVLWWTRWNRTQLNQS